MRRKVAYDPQQDYYAILGVSPNASPEEIRQAYRQCVRELHPDLNPDRAEWATRQLQRVNAAYDVLREPALRQQYDRARSGYAAATPRRSRTAATRPAAAPDRPWWQQAAEQSARARAYSDQSTIRSTPAWLMVAGWLRRGHLRALEPLWLTLVGLWRGPYAQALVALSCALALNVAFLVHALLSPAGLERLGLSADPTSTPTAMPSATPARLYQACLNPDARITAPSSGEVVGDTFPVVGTVALDNLWAYAVELGYAGPGQPQAAPGVWRPLRTPSPQQTIPEPPLRDAPLTDAPVDLGGQPAGFYVLRLRVILRDGTQRPVCDVVVRH
ncbi:J domain-containing protein [Candidatus Roseilinea sp. NK_OTU-006]|jgi:hypothetical protein|uniref:J domain-containing protein n=1 Tax=Candidatus Roseilinea sp. NK_OTU-006 TaxID=2704250 RepID=UPI00145C6599|nr:J domain-containing protein [Candidatus Roseilinea sp. NK_OTU-006]